MGSGTKGALRGWRILRPDLSGEIRWRLACPTLPSLRQAAPIAARCSYIRSMNWREDQPPLCGAPRLWGCAQYCTGPPALSFRRSGERRSYLRVGVFAGVHGDEESEFTPRSNCLERLHADPERARGYELFVYQFAIPWAYVEGSRWTRSGLDLNRLFWTGSNEPEVEILERQLRKLDFNGIIALHSDDTSEGLYGFVKGHELDPACPRPGVSRRPGVSSDAISIRASTISRPTMESSSRATTVSSQLLPSRNQGPSRLFLRPHTTGRSIRR